ncbi:hypothetical protein NIES4072_04270 [Nostoc commune NIES-4072]|uniref:Uncharacterized protein n=1 Tax=Nostoc commune NIES-4072 TaxID=2005467 RepID=A0A2R5FLW6_NOSCO|nr:hypothetical protein [Nostoc commune]BBD65894.1 hypothetical protein NIES4070_22550 [Nostoc commune HK-02]GBG16781.1 hypothetical protein NIES4072_04270 [Nostoc commune NIES-4072]
MKVNEWINKKFQESIFIRLTPSVEHAGRIRVQHKRCLTAKLCPHNFGRVLNVLYICIHYDINIAIAYGGRIRHRTQTSLETLLADTEDICNSQFGKA